MILQVGRFLASRVLTEPGAFTMARAAANGQPAFAAYLRGSDGVHRAHAIQVLTISGDRLRRIVSFNDAALFGVFGLGPVTPGG